MSPITHLLASWIIAVKTTDNPRDMRLVTMAGVIPDLDGLGAVVDIAKGSSNWFYYQEYHHWLTHGLPAAVVCSLVMGCFARNRWRVLWLSFLVFHLHLLCDLAGSRGPEPQDLWPIFYFGPFSRNPMIMWKYQWGLDAWPNRVLSVALFFWMLRIAVVKGQSAVGVFSKRLDQVVVGVLRKWNAQVRGG